MVHLGVERRAVLGGAAQAPAQLVNLLAQQHAGGRRGGATAGGQPCLNRRERKLDQRVAEPRRYLRPGHRHVQGGGLAALLDQTRIDPQPVDGTLELDDAHADERCDTEHLNVREVRRHRAVQVVIADPLAAPIDVRGRHNHAAAVDQQLAQRSERARAARQLLRLGDDDDVEPIVDLDAGVAVDADDARAQSPQILGTLFVRRASSDDGA